MLNVSALVRKIRKTHKGKYSEDWVDVTSGVKKKNYKAAVKQGGG